MFSLFKSHHIRGRVNPGEKDEPGLTGTGAGTGDLGASLASPDLANAAEWDRKTKRLNVRFIENLLRGVQWQPRGCLAHEIRDVAAKDEIEIDAGENKMEEKGNLGSPEVSTTPRVDEVLGRPTHEPALSV